MTISLCICTRQLEPLQGVPTKAMPSGTMVPGLLERSQNWSVKTMCFQPGRGTGTWLQIIRVLGWLIPKKAIEAVKGLGNPICTLVFPEGGIWYQEGYCGAWRLSIAFLVGFWTALRNVNSLFLSISPIQRGMFFLYLFHIILWRHLITLFHRLSWKSIHFKMNHGPGLTQIWFRLRL